MPTLGDFLATGRLGELSIGMSPDEVRALLGEPDDVLTGKRPKLWKYGSLQLVFSVPDDGSEASLVSFSLYFHSPDEKPPEALALTGWTPSGETTIEEFRAHLHDLGIPVDGEVRNGPGRQLALGSSVRVIFYEDGRLYSMGITARRDQAELKQLSISISKSDLNTIRREAAAHGVSMSKLCSMWIGERVANLQPH